MSASRRAAEALDELRWVCAALGHEAAALLDPLPALVSAEQIPPPCREQLVHHEHMTTTLADFYGEAVELEVLRAVRPTETTYSRMIRLVTKHSRSVVELGVMWVDFALLPPEVAEGVLAQRRPLGELLIRHVPLRQVEPRWYFRFAGESPAIGWFRDAEVRGAYGRVGVIRCDGAAAIRLLEVVPCGAELSGAG